MARQRVIEGSGAPTTNPPPPASERTLDMFAGQTKPLGQSTPAERSDEIKKSQDDAIARARARAVEESKAKALEQKILSEETTTYDAEERKAIQEEAGLVDAVLKGATNMADKVLKETIKGIEDNIPKTATIADMEAHQKTVAVPGFDPGAFFGKTEIKQEFRGDVDPNRVTEAFMKALPSGEPSDEGDTVEVTKAEEMYGRQGSFSSYRVGPFRLVAKVRAGETRRQVFARLQREINEMADEARENEKAKFLGHYPNAFTPTPAAS